MIIISTSEKNRLRHLLPLFELEVKTSSARSNHLAYLELSLVPAEASEGAQDAIPCVCLSPKKHLR